MEFYTEFNRPKTQPQEFGRNVLPVYECQIDKKGNKDLVQVDEIDFDEKINAWKDECDIYKIIEKYNITGDPGLLMSKRQAFFENFANIPKSPIELNNMINNVERKFDELDPEIRAIFDNSVDKVKAEIINGTLEETLKIKLGMKKQPKEETQGQEETTGGNDNE